MFQHARVQWLRVIVPEVYANVSIMAAAMEVDDEIPSSSSDKSTCKKRFEVKKVHITANYIYGIMSTIKLY